VLIQRGVAESQDRLRHVTARGSDRDVVVLLEVDTGVLLARVVGGAKEVTLQARVAGADDVLALNPPAFTTASGTAADATTTTAAASRAAVGIAVEAAAAGTTAAATGPRLSLLGGAIVAGAGPVATTGVEVVVAAGELVLIEKAMQIDREEGVMTYPAHALLLRPPMGPGPGWGPGGPFMGGGALTGGPPPPILLRMWGGM
jgi:hypothetical protein